MRHLVVVGEDVVLIDADQLRVFAEVTLGEYRSAQDPEFVALERPHLGLVEVQFLCHFEHADLLFPACPRQPFAAERNVRLSLRRLFDGLFLLFAHVQPESRMRRASAEAG